MPVVVVGFLGIGSALQPMASADVFHGHWIGGKILEAYDRNGGHPALGNAITPESNAARNGKFQVFDRNASIYWHPLVDGATAHLTGGEIRDKWAQLGWENGILRYPVSDELSTIDRTGKYNFFEGGSIFWSPNTGAHQMGGAIQSSWLNSGWNQGVGFPTTDETSTPDGTGKYNHFQNGSIYWSPNTGAHPVRGRIRDFWGQEGWERSTFGYPTSAERNVRVGAVQSFQNGDIQWVPTNNSTLPPAENGYGTYNHQYLVFGEEPRRWSPESINREVLQHFSNYFTFTGCGDEVYVGLQCNLDTVLGLEAPIEIVGATATGFAIRSLEGHPEGAGRTITFNFYRWNVAGTGQNEIRMDVRAWGPVSAGSYLGPLNSETLARVSWSRFVRNIVERIDNASTTYVTADKNIGSAPMQRRQSAPQTNLPVGIEQGEFIDPWQVDVSGVGTEVPLEPRETGTAPTSEPAPTPN